MTRARLGPWLKLYGDIIDRKGHYTDRQFHALIEVLVLALRSTPRGTLPPRPSLEARLGVDEVAFLFTQRDLQIIGETVSVCGWDVYQSGVLSTSRVQKSRSERVETVPERDETVSESSPLPLPLSSTKTDERIESGADASYPDPDSDRDSLDRYMELTGSRLWGKPAGRWLKDLEATHGLTHIVAALEVEHKADPNTKDLIGRVEGRLLKQADRVASATRSKPRTLSPLQAEIRAGIVERYGEGETVVLGSVKNGQAQALTDVGTAGSTSPTRGPERGTPSPGAPAVRPSSRGPFTEASTDEAEGAP